MLVYFDPSPRNWSIPIFLGYTERTMGRGANHQQAERGVALATLERLIADRRIAPERHDEIVIHAQRTQTTAEEAILQLGLLEEAELLRYIANLYRTRFVGSERLAKAGIDRRLLAQVPSKLAARLIAIPILFDAKSRTLSVAAADVTDEDVRQQMLFATGARDVKVYAAREAAVRAAIAKHYDGNEAPFQLLFSGAASRDVRTARESEPIPGWGQVFEDKDGQLVERAAGNPYLSEPANDAVPYDPEQEVPKVPPPARSVSRSDVPAAHEVDVSGISIEHYLGTLEVVVGRLEARDRDREGHSARVANMCRELCDGLGLTPTARNHLLAAAYLHDLGIANDGHVTPLDLARQPSQQERARRAYAAPIGLIESVGLPAAVVGALRHRFERYDGDGFPQRLGGNAIPIGARVLAVAESYVTLTQGHARTALPPVSPEDACALLEGHRGSTFDPRVVDQLSKIVSEEARRHRPSGRGISGSLEEMSLADLIQLLAGGRKTGRLEVVSGTLYGQLMFQGGAIHDAALGDLEGAEAVYAILRLTTGHFVLEPDPSPVTDRIGIPTQHLLLEAMRLLDESGQQPV